MTFTEYWKALASIHGAKSKFSRETGIALPRLGSIAAGRIRVGYETAIKIERATNKACTRKELAPHLEW